MQEGYRQCKRGTGTAGGAQVVQEGHRQCRRGTGSAGGAQAVQEVGAQAVQEVGAQAMQEGAQAVQEGQWQCRRRTGSAGRKISRKKTNSEQNFNFFKKISITNVVKMAVVICLSTY